MSTNKRAMRRVPPHGRVVGGVCGHRQRGHRQRLRQRWAPVDVYVDVYVLFRRNSANVQLGLTDSAATQRRPARRHIAAAG
jgi:hypothetical protein